MLHPRRDGVTKRAPINPSRGTQQQRPQESKARRAMDASHSSEHMAAFTK